MKKLSLLFALTLCPLLIANAQTQVTFNIDLKPMLRDSTFVPGRDQVQIVGNFFPLGFNRSMQMKEGITIDSVYTAQLSFSSRYRNQELKYNFQIITPTEVKEEHMPRRLTLIRGKIELPPLLFDAFPW